MLENDSNEKDSNKREELESVEEKSSPLEETVGKSDALEEKSKEESISSSTELSFENKTEAPVEEKTEAPVEEKTEAPVEEKTEAIPNEFEGFGLAESLLANLKEKGWNKPTDIQEKSLPLALKGEDVVGFAQTGSGKTGAFLITLVQNVLIPNKGKARKQKAPLCLVICPVRELAIQIAQEAESLLSGFDIKTLALLGGANIEQQMKNLEEGVDLVVATPGRLIDLYERGALTLKDVKLFVCDEVDRMFDLGFKKDVDFIFNKVPTDAQKLVFSATFNEQTKTVCSELLAKPHFVHVHRAEITPDTMTQEAIICQSAEKIKLLLHMLKKHDPVCAIVFTNTKLVASWLQFKLEKNNYNAEMISGDLPQNKRTRLIEEIKSGKVRVLIATDVASRGLDIPQVSHVYNFDLPNEAASYVHRIGRTARGGAKGASYSFICEDYGHNFEGIKRILKNETPVPQRLEEGLLDDVEDLAENPFAKESKKAPAFRPQGQSLGQGTRAYSSPSASYQSRSQAPERRRQEISKPSHSSERRDRKPGYQERKTRAQQRANFKSDSDRMSKPRRQQSNKPYQKKKSPQTIGGMFKRIFTLIFPGGK